MMAWMDRSVMRWARARIAGSSAWSSARHGIAIGAVMSEMRIRSRIDSGVSRPMRTLSRVS